MPGLLQNIATAFEDLGPRQGATTAIDVSDIQKRLGLPALIPAVIPGPSTAAATPAAPLTVQAGTYYVHNRRTDDQLPTMPTLMRTGYQSVDTTFQRKSEMLVQELQREFSEFSLAGLAWSEQAAREDGKLAAERAEEDALLAKKRFEEDAQIAAKRQQQDAERSQHDGVAGNVYRSTREQEQTALLARWKNKFAELAASLEEATAAHEQQAALEEQRKQEEIARAQAHAAREAAEAAERASRHTELAEDARRLAELAALRVATAPSVRSLALVSASHVPPALGYACPIAGTPLRLGDRSWWKTLYLLEAEGLTPPLKATEQAANLFAALDDDSDGAVACPDAGYLLGLLTSGSLRDRVDATCDAPGAPATGVTVTPLAAVRQLQLCAKARKLCAPKLAALLLNAPAADATTMPPVPPPEALERSVATLFAGAASIPADKFRSWAASTPTVATLFAPLSRY